MESNVSVDVRRDEIRHQVGALLLELDSLQGEVRAMYSIAPDFRGGEPPAWRASESTVRRHRQLWSRIGEIGRDLQERHEEFFWLES